MPYRVLASVSPGFAARRSSRSLSASARCALSMARAWLAASAVVLSFSDPRQIEGKTNNNKKAMIRSPVGKRFAARDGHSRHAFMVCLSVVTPTAFRLQRIKNQVFLYRLCRDFAGAAL